MKKLYEYEIQRTNITPKQFFTYCKNQLKKKNFDIENRVGFDDWESPFAPYESTCNHEDWEEPQKEICKTKPYEWQLFLQNAYNFIMEFDFYDENKGFGYFYIIEFER